jgi:tetrahydromethanopterin S-methyltransferase subunit D
MNTLNQSAKSKAVIRKVAFAVIVLIVAGLLLDLYTGFYYLSHFKSIYAALAGLLLLGVFYLVGEAGSEWIGGKDDVKDPLYKRVFRLLALLLFAALLMTVIWFTLKYLGLMRI